MSSGDKKLNIVTKRILGWQSFKDNLLDYLDDHDRDLIAQVFKTSGTFVALSVAASGTDEYAITGYGALGVVDAIDGLGNMLDLYNKKTYNDNVPFENITGQDYHVAIRKASLPSGITVSQEDGQPNFDTYEEIVGWEADPDQVIDNLDGTLTFQVDSVTESGVTNAGRTVAVYKKTPGLGALTESEALETLTVAWASSQNRITTASNFGQTTASTTASDYRVVLLGPRTSRDTDLRLLTDWCFVGIVDGKTGVPPDTFDMSDQELIDIPFSDWAHIVRYEPVPPDRLKIEVEALAGESGVDQIRINHLGTGITFKVDEAGNITTTGKVGIGGAVGTPQLKVTGDGEFTTNLKILGILRVYDDLFDLHHDGTDPYVLFDTDDYLRFERSQNDLTLNLGGAAKYHWRSSNFYPEDDDAVDLGKSDKQWKDLFVDGTANIDKLVLSTAASEGASDLFPYGTVQELGSTTRLWAMVNAKGLRACDASPGGAASTVTFTSDVSGISTGAGTVKMNSANPGTNSGWLKIYTDVAVVKWMPFWDTNAP